MKSSIKVIVAASLIGLSSMTAMAAFTTSEYGSGSYTAGSSVGDILQNFLGGDGLQAIETSDLSALATALASADSFDYSSNPSLSIFDEDNDGMISEQEFVNILAGMAAIDNVDTSSNGIYAQAYATELAAMTAPITEAKIQAAINDGNNYSVNSPDILASALTFLGTNSSHSGILGIQDGFDNTLSGGTGNCSTTVTATHATDTDAANRFDVTADGNLVLASGVDIEDLEPGTYTVSVTATDTNSSTYGLSTTSDVSLTVSNEKGCIVNNGITSSNFSAGDNSSTITGATVTISGDHSTNDKLFVRTASSITTDNTTGDVVYKNITGYSAIDNATYDKSSGELVFKGTTTLANWIEIFKLVGFIYDDNGTPTNTRSLIFSLSDNIPYNHPDGSDHFYNFISGNKTFNDARVAANNSTLFGLQGYLATITSAAEQTYIYPKIGGQGWIGACDYLGDTTTAGHCGLTTSEVNNLKLKSSWVDSNGSYDVGDGEGYWYWVTGPERLSYMGHDEGNKSNNCRQRTYAQNGVDVFNQASADETYTNFRGAEPNNYLVSNCSQDAGGEHMMHFYSDGKWNDYSNNSGSIQGYLIEYGGMSGDPTVDLTEDKSYNISTEGQFCAHQ